MNNISLLLPKNRRPVWTPGLETVDETLDNELSTYIEIPLLGKITAGNPIERVEDNESIKVPANMVRKDTYALKVSGHSMIDDNIQDGDIIIVEKKLSAENGQSITANQRSGLAKVSGKYFVPWTTDPGGGIGRW